MIVFVWLLLQHLVAGANITILQQQNVVEHTPDLGNGILCQNLTDKWNNPVLMAADDLVIPSPNYLRSLGVARGMDDCGAMSLQLTTMRRKNDLSPSLVTLLFMRHNDTTGLPASTVFYQKSFRWPTNNYMWQSDPLNRPWNSIFTLQLNEVGDDGVTRFNFRDTTDFMPPDQTIWVGLYATLSLHDLNQRFQFNALMWVTLNNHTGSTPVAPFASNGAANRDFAFRDTNDYMGDGFTQWTTAVPVERVLMITPTTNNLAWSVWLDCATQAVTAPSVAPSAPPPPVATGAPTAAPTNTTVNTTAVDGGGGNALRLMWVVALPLTLLVAVVCVGFVVWHIRRRRGGPSQQTTAPTPMAALSSSDASEVSLFESFEDLGGGGETHGTRYFPVALNSRTSSPVMQSLPVATTTTTTNYDHNNPFSPTSSDLLRVVISEDEED